MQKFSLWFASFGLWAALLFSVSPAQALNPQPEPPGVVQADPTERTCPPRQPAPLSEAATPVLSIGSQSTGAGAGKITFNPFSISIDSQSTGAGAGKVTFNPFSISVTKTVRCMYK